MRTGTLFALALAAASQATRAADPTIVSPGADAVAVTIYRDDLALITETRTVNLPEGPATLVIRDVAETLLPQSTVIADLGRPLEESNFDFDRLTPATLLERSVGDVVTLTRTSPETGRVVRTTATVLSAVDGVVLRSTDGTEAIYCSGLPERIEFERVPEGLVPVPQLSVRLAAGETGPKTIKVSYLAHGFSWSTDYVARLDERSERMTLLGWATLTNATGASFRQADVQVVAGALNLLDEEVGGSRAAEDTTETSERERAAAEIEAANLRFDRLRDCYSAPLQRFKEEIAPQLVLRMAADRAGPLEEIVVTAVRAAAREELGDYQLYRIPWSTDLGARQSKQVALVTKPAVRIERLYGFRLSSLTDSPDEGVIAPNLVVRFENTRRAGLGEPLPSGVVRVFERYRDGEVFAGEAYMDDRPVGLPVELTIARAQNVGVEVTRDYDRVGSGSRERTVVGTQHRIVNNKSVPIDIEIRDAVGSEWRSVKVRQASETTGRKYGDLAWRFEVPAKSEHVLRYEISALEY